MFKELLGEAFPILEKIAPVVAGAIGSPAAGVATMFGMNILSNALGVSPNNLESAILNHPDATDKLKLMESQFAEWFKNNSGQIKMPSSMELNVKVNWNNAE